MLLTTKQAAERLGLSTARVRKLASDGKLKPAMRVGDDTGQALYTPAEIDRFAALDRPAQRPVNPDSARQKRLKAAEPERILENSSRRKSSKSKTLHPKRKKTAKNSA